jgi:hypothetical protein
LAALIAEAKAVGFVSIVVGATMAYILFYNNNTSETQYWFMRGPGAAVIDGDIVLVPAPDPNDQFIIDSRGTAKDEKGKDIFVGLPFSIVGTNGQQIVWHHSQTFETQIWTMAGTGIVRRDTVHDENDKPIFVGPPFRIVGACSKFSTLGNPYIVWFNDSTFETQIWIMNENTFSGVGGIKIHDRRTVLDENSQPIFVGPPFRIVGAFPDRILWHHDETHETQIWFTHDDGKSIRIRDRRTVLGENSRPIFVGPPFRIVGMANFHGDPSLHDVGDIVWHNDATNETQIWIMEDDGMRIARRQTVLDENHQKIFVGLPFHIVGVATPGR